VEESCKRTFYEVAEKYNFTIHALEIQPDHVHLIVDCPRTLSDAQLMQIVKGLSSYILFRLCPDLRLRYSKGHF